MTHLSPQISHLVAARPMSVTMGNAIRQLKLEISDSDIDLPEQDVSTPVAVGARALTSSPLGERRVISEDRQLYPRSDYHCRSSHPRDCRKQDQGRRHHPYLCKVNSLCVNVIAALTLCVDHL